MNFETIKCQVSFFYGRLTFFLSKSTKGERFSCHWHFCPSLPKVKVLIVIGLICPSLPMVKVLFSLPRFLLLVTLAMNANGENSVIWSVPLSNLWHPAQPQIL